jgi:Ca2+:H+ antiporter
LKRARSGPTRRVTASDETTNTNTMPADENTGLLSVNGNGNGNGRVRKRSTFSEFFLDTRHTPGMESENPFVRFHAHVFNVTKVTLLSNYVNILLIFVPLGIVAGATHWDPTVVFILNFFAIVPLAAVLSFATEEISVKLGQTMGGLLNATFGNAVELIVGAVTFGFNKLLTCL